MMLGHGRLEPRVQRRYGVAQGSIHPGIAVLKARLRDYLTARGLSDRQFGVQSGLSDATVRRLWQVPHYVSKPDTWRKVARGAGWSEVEVLATGGMEPSDATPPDGWRLISEGMLQLGLRVREQEQIRDYLEALLLAQAHRSPPGPSTGGT